MKSIVRRLSVFVLVLVLGLAAAWIVHPEGSKINLKKIGINYEKYFNVQLGLDLKGGAHLVYKADFKDISDVDKRDALNSVRDTIERRVNSFGVSEPVVQIQGSDQVVV